MNFLEQKKTYFTFRPAKIHSNEKEKKTRQQHLFFDRCRFNDLLISYLYNAVTIRRTNKKNTHFE